MDLREPVPAAVIDRFGGSPRIATIALPECPPGRTLIEVWAAPLNPLDLLVASGKFHSAGFELPYVPGSECAGTVVQSARFAPGTWVYAECYPPSATPGLFAHRAVVPDENLCPIPDGVEPVLAAAVGNSGTAAYLSLVQEASLQAGETVLILGATGIVGQIAVQVARSHRAGRVVGVGRDETVLERLLGQGADAVIALRPGEGETVLADRIRAAAGPVDVVLDGLYGTPLQAAVQACAPRARVVNVGNLAGPTAQLPAGLLRSRQLTLSGFAGGLTPLADKEQALAWLWAAAARGDLPIEVRTFPLQELPLAWRAQADSPHAKCVALPNGALPSPSAA